MDFSMFLVFPGILITIGVGLLLLSIIIVIVAYKTADKPEPNYLSQVDYAKNLESKNNYNFNNNFNSEIKNEENKNISYNTNNIIEERENNNLNNNSVQGKELSEIKDNNLENNLETTKVFKVSDGLGKDNKFTRVENSDEEEKEERIDIFGKEFESLEEPLEEELKIEDLNRKNSVTTQNNKQEKEEDEEEIEIL